jgi:hypothetical protein
MARRCFPVTLIGKDCGFESRPGRSFAIVGAHSRFLPFPRSVSKLESKGELGIGAGKPNITSARRGALAPLHGACEMRCSRSIASI